jgi:hypothetical protein
LKLILRSVAETPNYYRHPLSFPKVTSQNRR